MRRFLSLTLLLICEGLALGVPFDSTEIQKLPAGWWTHLFDYTHIVMPMGTLIGAAVFLIAGMKVRRIAIAVPAEKRDHMPAYVAIQIAVFLVFLGLTIALFQPIASAMEHPGEWVIAWLAGALATCLLWLRALLPLRTISAIIAGAGGRLFAGVAVGAAAWGAGFLTQAEWWDTNLTALSTATLDGAAAILRAFDPDVAVEPANFIIRDGSFPAQVSYQCSGYEGIGLMWVFLAVYFWMFRKRLRFPGALLLVPAATLLIWLTNLVRIAALVWIGAHLSRGVAVGGFHSFAGTVLFMFISVGTVLVAEHSRLFCKQPEKEEAAQPNPAAFFLIPFLAAIAMRLITGLFTTEATGSIDPFVPLSSAAAVVALWFFRRDFHRLEWGISPVAAIAGAAVFGIWMALPHSGTNPAQSAESWFPAWIGARCLGYVAVTPIIEELAFRGYLARRIMSADFNSVPLRNLSWPAILISSALFAAAHFSLWPGAFIAGVAYAWAARRSGRLTDAIIAHATTNALLAITAIATHSWWLLG